MTIALMFLTLVTMATPTVPQTAPAQTTPSPSRSETSAELPNLVKTAGPAVISLRTYDKQGVALGLGSGFLVEGGRVVTNAHVVDHAARVEVYDFEDRILGTVDYAESLSNRIDLAILPPLPNAPAILRLATNEPPVGESIVVIGAPQGLTNTVSTGIVSAFRDHDGKKWMQISAPISEGSSGGPVLNQAGEVVGVSVAVLRDGQNLNFAVPTRDLRALMGSPPGRIVLAGAQAEANPPPVSTPANAIAPPPARFNLREILLKQPRITAGKPIDSVLDENDTLLDSGKRVEMFTSEGRAGDIYTVFVFSDSFDPTLTAIRAGSAGETEKLGYDDDGAGGTDARLVIRLPDTGLIGLVVSSARQSESGTYRIGLFKGNIALPETTNSQTNDRWILAARSTGLTVYIDKTTIRKTSTTRRRVWERWDHEDWQTNSEDRYNKRKSLQEYDCAERASRNISVSVRRTTCCGALLG